MQLIGTCFERLQCQQPGRLIIFRTLNEMVGFLGFSCVEAVRVAFGQRDVLHYAVFLYNSGLSYPSIVSQIIAISLWCQLNGCIRQPYPRDSVLSSNQSHRASRHELFLALHFFGGDGVVYSILLSAFWLNLLIVEPFSSSYLAK